MLVLDVKDYFFKPLLDLTANPEVHLYRDEVNLNLDKAKTLFIYNPYTDLKISLPEAALNCHLQHKGQFSCLQVDNHLSSLATLKIVPIYSSLKEAESWFRGLSYLIISLSHRLSKDYLFDSKEFGFIDLGSLTPAITKSEDPMTHQIDLDLTLYLCKLSAEQNMDYFFNSNRLGLIQLLRGELSIKNNNCKDKNILRAGESHIVSNVDDIHFTAIDIVDMLFWDIISN